MWLTNRFWSKVVEGSQEDSKRRVDAYEPSKREKVVYCGEEDWNLEDGLDRPLHSLKEGIALATRVELLDTN